MPIEESKTDRLLALLCENVSTFDMKDAHVYDRVGYEVGDALMEVLAEQGFSDKESEWWFRSKHARWFMDEFGPKISSSAKKHLEQSLKTNRNKVMDDIAKLRKGVTV